jgi:hypothetical protein
MHPSQDQLTPILGDSVADVSYGIVYVLSAIFMLIPVVMLFGLVYAGIRQNRATRVDSDG